MINQQVLSDLKNFNWQFIVDYGNSLCNFNESQWRFLKGFIVEITIEKNSEPTLKYVGAEHKDYDWHKYDMSVELKSQLSDSMYTKAGNLRKNYTIKLNNSNGTNNNQTLPDNHVADLLIVIRNDGAFVIDKETVLANAIKQGDGFSVKVSNDLIVEISGRIFPEKKYSNTLRESILKAIEHDIENAQRL